MVPRTSVQVQSRSKLMSAMYCITHKIVRLSQVICANGSRKFKIIEAPNCPCGKDNQTAERILLECEILKEERERLEQITGP